MDKLNLDQAGQVTGGFVLNNEEKKEIWVVKQDGSKIAPAANLDEARRIAKQYNISPTVLTEKDYKEHYGRDFV